MCWRRKRTHEFIVEDEENRHLMPRRNSRFRQRRSRNVVTFFPSQPKSQRYRRKHRDDDTLREVKYAMPEFDAEQTSKSFKETVAGIQRLQQEDNDSLGETASKATYRGNSDETKGGDGRKSETKESPRKLASF